MYAFNRTEESWWRLTVSVLCYCQWRQVICVHVSPKYSSPNMGWNSHSIPSEYPALSMRHWSNITRALARIIPHGSLTKRDMLTGLDEIFVQYLDYGTHCSAHQSHSQLIGNNNRSNARIRSTSSPNSTSRIRTLVAKPYTYVRNSEQTTCFNAERIRCVIRMTHLL